MLCVPEMWKRHTIALLMLPVSSSGEKNEYYHLKETNVMSAWEKHAGFRSSLCVSWTRPLTPSHPRRTPTPLRQALIATKRPPSHPSLTHLSLHHRATARASKCHCNQGAPKGLDALLWCHHASPFTQEGIKDKAWVLLRFCCLFTLYFSEVIGLGKLYHLRTV